MLTEQQELLLLVRLATIIMAQKSRHIITMIHNLQQMEAITKVQPREDMMDHSAMQDLIQTIRCTRSRLDGAMAALGRTGREGSRALRRGDSTAARGAGAAWAGKVSDPLWSGRTGVRAARAGAGKGPATGQRDL